MASFFGSKLLISILLLSFSLYVFCDEEPEQSDDPSPIEDENDSQDDNSEAAADDSDIPPPEEDEGVLILTDNNFDSVVDNAKIILVEFYAPWCGHCKSLAPEYAKAAKRLALLDSPIPLAKVDAVAEEGVAKRFGVQGYPTLKIFRNGQAEDYDGPREEEGIVKHMLEKGDPNYKPPPESVITLTTANFDEVTKEEDIMLVEFYAPWCGHCKKLAPKLEKAATELAKEVPAIKIAKVDADSEPDLAKTYGVSGYPTMKIFRKGEASDYKGEREANDIVDYMKKQSGDPSELVADKKSLKIFLDNGDEPVVLALMKDETDPMLKLYFAANNDIRDDFRFGHTFNAALKKKFGVKESCILLIHPEHLQSPDEHKQHILKATSVEEISTFYTDHQTPLVGHCESHTEKRFKKPGKPLVLVLYDVDFDVKMRSMTQYWRNKVIEVAKHHSDITFAVANEESFTEKLKEAGRAESGEDVNVILYDDSGRRYALDDEFSEESLNEFIEEFEAGNLKPILKSQKAPKKQKAVKVVVGNTFDEIVKDGSKEVLIEFYAPWCGHCKSLEPIYKKLAEKYKTHKNLVIAKIDATANEAPSQYEATGFPTIYWAPPGKKDSPVLYSGERTLEGFDKFLQENSNVVPKVPKEEPTNEEPTTNEESTADAKEEL